MPRHFALLSTPRISHQGDFSMNHWRKLTLAFATFVILLGPMSGTASLRVAAAPLRAQPALLQLAAAQPDSLVAVIVQKANASGAAEALVARLGGTITKDLHIINAFAAEMTASAARELAASPSVRWVSLDAPVRSSQATAGFTTWATSLGTVTSNGFTDAAAMIDSALGPNDSYGYGGNVTGAFAGFMAEVTPGNAISKVEVVLKAYMPAPLSGGGNLKLTVFVGGTSTQAVNLK